VITDEPSIDDYLTDCEKKVGDCTVMA
jgi:hypothetical protein